MMRNYIKKALSILSISVLILCVPLITYAKTYEAEPRDIKVDIPKDWYFVSEDTDIYQLDRGLSYERIFDAFKDDFDVVGIYLYKQYADNYHYFYDEDIALDAFENDCSEVVEDFFYELMAITDFNWDEPSCIQNSTDDQYWVKCRCVVADEDDGFDREIYIYVNAYEDCIYRIIFGGYVFSGEEHTVLPEEVEIIDDIVCSYSDPYTYGEEHISDEGEYSDEDYEEDSSFWGAISPLLLIFAVSAILIQRKTTKLRSGDRPAGAKPSGRTRRSPVTSAKPFVSADPLTDNSSTVTTDLTVLGVPLGESSPVDIGSAAALDSTPAAPAPKRHRHSDKKLERTTIDGITSTTYSCSYEESLRVLYRSGILTREELDVMLGKHRRRLRQKRD